MVSVYYDIGRGDTYLKYCNGSVLEFPGDSYVWGTTISEENSQVFRPSTNEVTNPDTDLRPYTNHWCNGVRYSGNPKGVVRRVNNSVCPVPPGAQLEQTQRVMGVLASGIQLGDYTDPGITENERAGLLTQAYADVQQGLFDASTNLGELPEIVSMLAKVRQRILMCFEETVRHALRVEELDRFFKRRKGWVFADLVEFLSNLWLEWRYGWRPLADAAHDLNKAIVALKLPGSNVRSGHAKRELILPRSVSVTQESFSNSFHQNLVIEGDTRRVDRANVAAVLMPKDFAFTVDYIATAWNLIPLSFIVNWFIDIESFIRGMTRFPRHTQVTMCESSLLRSRYKVTGIVPPGGTWEEYVEYDVPISFGYEEFTYQRNKVAAFTPRIVTSFNLGSGDSRIFDLLALMFQRLLR